MKPTDLRGILQYIPRYRDKTFVISVDGAIVARENFGNILTDIAVLRSLSIRVVLAHGASAQIQDLAAEKQFAPSNVDGTGVTDAETLSLALTAANRLTHEVMEGLSSYDLRAVCPNAIIAHPAGIIKGVDHLYTGKVERVDVGLLETLLSQGIVPVIPPLGFDGDGKTYRVNSDSIAVSVAEALKATKLIYITSSDGLIFKNQLLREITVNELTLLLQEHKTDFADESISKAEHAAAACLHEIPRVHVINGCVDEGLLAEVFSNEGIGTLVYANEYRQVRKALKKDIQSIMLLTQTSVENDEMLKRSRATIEKRLADYYIFEIDKNPVACVALHTYPEARKGEVACLYVHPSHENRGIGKILLKFAEEKARESGLEELIVLSTQAFTYFQSKAGYAEGSSEDLPAARREKYEQSGRKSKILVKKLSKPQGLPTPLSEKSAAGMFIR